MATTTNYSWNLPTVGGNQDAWGSLLNDNWSAVDTLLGGVNATEFAILDGATVTTAELNILDGVTATTAELNTLSGINTASNFGLVPSGAILLWSGSTASVPSGWYLCDGANGTPDLRDRFVVGAGGSYAVGATGGAASVTLDSTQIPSHTHTFSGVTNTTGDHYHLDGEVMDAVAEATYGYTASTAAGRVDQSSPETKDQHAHTSTAGAHAHTFSGTTSATGGGASHENRPPYYALAYIMKA